MDERRHFDRLKLDGNVSIKSESGTLLDFKAFLDNISFLGFAMYAPQKIDTDSVVDFELNTQQLDHPLTGKGRVTYVVNPVPGHSPFYTMGVEFVETNKDLVTYLIKRLHSKMSENARNKTKVAPVDFIPY
jgi:hypothetical protein